MSFFYNYNWFKSDLKLFVLLISAYFFLTLYKSYCYFDLSYNFRALLLWILSSLFIKRCSLFSKVNFSCFGENISFKKRKDTSLSIYIKIGRYLKLFSNEVWQAILLKACLLLGVILILKMDFGPLHLAVKCKFSRNWFYRLVSFTCTSCDYCFINYHISKALQDFY